MTTDKNKRFIRDAITARTAAMECGAPGAVVLED